jgi:hypothetical protein
MEAKKDLQRLGWSLGSGHVTEEGGLWAGHVTDGGSFLIEVEGEGVEGYLGRM